MGRLVDMENIMKDTIMCKDVYVDGSYRDGIISGAIIFVDVDERLNKEFYFSIKKRRTFKTIGTYQVSSLPLCMQCTMRQGIQ